MSIWSWFVENKQWLFSGVGVTAIVVVGGLLYRRFFSSPNPPVTASLPLAELPVETTRFTKPTPLEIIEGLYKLPPFQQAAAANAHKGLVVCWKAELGGISKDPTTLLTNVPPARNPRKKSEKQAPPPKILWSVSVHYHDPKARWNSVLVTCTQVDIDKYPQLKVAHAGTSIVVSGKIERVDRMSIELVDVDLQFPA